MRIALTQFDPVSETAVNAAHIGAIADRAAADGAALLLAPEGSIVGFLTDPPAAARAAEPLDGPFVAALAAASARAGICVAAGMFEPDPVSGRVFNTLVVLRAGELVAAYRKIHLYDAFAYLESETVAPGSVAPPVIEIDGVAVGFATCYDLRFPELFRVLQQGGAQVLALVSAWVRGPLKEEHWLTLLRARAIENTCYVVAVDQVGKAGVGRSAAFDPLGLPLLDLGVAAPGYGTVDIHPARLAEVRSLVPSAAHARFRISAEPADPIGVRWEARRG